MNQKRSPGEQLILIVMLSFSAFLLSQYFFGAKNKNPGGPPRPVPAFNTAFAGLDLTKGVLLSQNQGLAQVATLQTAIAVNNQDEYSYWARLRAGLIKQYILQDSKGAVALYDEIIHRNGHEAIDAQALYQKGDLLWQQSAGQETPSHEAVKALEQILTRGRGNSAFLNLEIFVPPSSSSLQTSQPSTPAVASASVLPEGGWEKVKVHDLLRAPLPRGILVRVDHYYSKTSWLYKVFDSTVRALGSQPQYSYGLAIIIFAVMTRLLLQPLNKKQYDSMKGMQLIAPEMKKIQEKYKGKSDQDSQMKMMREIRALQQMHGVNPMMGCGLAFLQMPIFFLLVYPLIQHYEPKMELVNASFLWIRNLAHPDIPLLVAYAISMFLSFRLSATPPTDEQQRQMQTMMGFIFPIMMPFFLKSWPSAFTMYWMIYNVVSTIFQWRMMKAAEPEKSIVKSLMGTPPAIASPDADVVPPRPSSAASVPSKSNSSKSSAGQSNKSTTKKPAKNMRETSKSEALRGETPAFDSPSEPFDDEPAEEAERVESTLDGADTVTTPAAPVAIAEKKKTDSSNRSKVSSNASGNGARSGSRHDAPRARRRRRY